MYGNAGLLYWRTALIDSGVVTGTGSLLAGPPLRPRRRSSWLFGCGSRRCSSRSSGRRRRRGLGSRSGRCEPDDGHGKGDQVQNMNGPPDVLDAQLAHHHLISPLVLVKVEPQAQEAGVSTILAHHAAQGDLTDAGVRRICVGLVPWLTVPAVAIVFLFVFLFVSGELDGFVMFRNMMPHIAAFVVVASEDQASAALA